MESSGDQGVQNIINWFAQFTDVEIMKQKLITSLIVIGVIFMIGQLTTIVRRLCYNIICNRAGSRAAQFFDTKLTFIGVIHHELSHALMVILSGAKLTKITIIKHGDALGAVYFKPRGNKLLNCLQYQLVSIGPIIFGTIQITVLCNTVLSNIGEDCLKSWVFWVQLLLVQQIAYHMQLQKQDVKNLLKGIIPQAIIFICLLCLINFDLAWLRVYVQAIIYAEVLNIVFSFVIQGIFSVFIRK